MPDAIDRGLLTCKPARANTPRDVATFDGISGKLVSPALHHWNDHEWG